MNKEEQQAEKYWAYQAKQENLQRMVDKGWGDREEYNKLLAWEAKRARNQRWKNKANEIATGKSGCLDRVADSWPMITKT